MQVVNKLNKFIKSMILDLEILTYFITIIIISYSIIYSSFIYFKGINEGPIIYIKSRIRLGESVSLSLSFILGIEILKLYYIKTYKQLILVGSIVTIKLCISYFLGKEIDEDYLKKKKFGY